MKNFILFFLIFSSFILNAQKPELEFEEIKFSNEKPLTFISDFYQSPEGLIWFLNYENELFYFDGYNIKQLINVPGDSASYPQPNIESLFWGNDGTLLINDEKKIIDFSNLRLNKLSNHFPAIPDTLFFKKIIEDKNDNLWILAYNGLYFYDKKNDSLKSFSSHYNLEKIDKILNSSKLITELTGTEKHKDTSITFSISEDSKVAIISSGIAEENKMLDNIILLKDNDTIWQIKYKETEYAGGDVYDRMNFTKLYLVKGNYSVNYSWKSRYSYSVFSPTSVDFCGAKVYKYQESIENSNAFLKTEGIKDEIIDVSISETGEVFLLTLNGVYTGNENKGFKFNRIPFESFIDKKIDLYQIISDKNNTCWISGNIGLLSYNLNQNKLSKINKNEYLYYLKYDSKNNLIWGNGSKGVFYYDIINKKTVYIDVIKEISKKIDLNNSKIYLQKVFSDNSGNLFVSTTRGIFKSKIKKFCSFNPKIERYRLYWRPMILRDSIIYFLDYENNTVLKTFNLKNNESQSYFITKSGNVYKNRFYVDTNNKIWIAARNSVKLYNINKESVEKTIKFDKSAGNILYFYEDTNKYLWIFTENNIYKKRRNIDEFQYIKKFKPDTSSDKYIDYIIEIKNNLYIRTKTGIYSFNLSDYKLQTIALFNEKYFDNFWYHGNIIFDKDKNKLWFSTERNLFSYSIQNKELHKYPFYKGTLREINFKSNSAVLKDGNLIWIISCTGLYSFSIKEKFYSHYTMEDGLPNNSIIQITKDDNDNIWLASTSAITKFNKNYKTFENYYLEKDYTGIRLLYNSSNKIYKSKDKIGFWGLDGLVTFNPNKINKTPPPIIITKFELFNKEFILDSVIYVKKRINLNYDQNSIGFEFSALDYSDPKRNQYAYKLEGIDKDWIYTNYKKRFAESNNDGIWNEKGISLKIIITPPFWKTWWFYSLEVLLAVFLIYLFVKFRERKLKKDNEKLEKIVKIRTQEVIQQKEEIETQKEEIQTIADNLIVANEEVTKQKDEIEEIHKHVTESIEYASRIQQAILPPKELIKKHLPEHFILFKPRDIVSGDFYWLKQIGNYTVYAAADCTGHGVPGAFMSMLGISFLNEIVTKTRFDNAGEILNRLRKKIKTSLRQTGKDGESKDGMDIAICVIDNESLQLEYSGAYNPLYIIRKGELTEIKATRNPVGIYLKEKPFENHKFQLEKGDVIYTFSDGYVDQFGGKNESKFKSKNFKKLLLEIYNKPMQEQGKILDTVLLKWQGKTEQTDDIVVFGVKI